MAAFEECPNCGARFKRGRLACPECGSDAATGWRSSEDLDYESVEIPDFWDEAAMGSRRRSPRWWIAILLALLGMLAFALAR